VKLYHLANQLIRVNLREIMRKIICKIVCCTCKKEFDCRKYQYRKNGLRYLPRFCSKECRKFENFSKDQKLEILKISFEKDVIRKEQCWDWKGAKHEDGYSKLSISYKIGIQSGHGASYIIHIGEIPKGMVIRHKCHNPVCTNPNHLEIGTIKENIRDSVDAGRNARGSRNNKAKLKENDVINIQRMIEEKITNEEIAKNYNVSKSTIECIKYKRSWKHVNCLKGGSY
jgi:hypothetical protein